MLGDPGRASLSVTVGKISWRSTLFADPGTLILTKISPTPSSWDGHDDGYETKARVKEIDFSVSSASRSLLFTQMFYRFVWKQMHFLKYSPKVLPFLTGFPYSCQFAVFLSFGRKFSNNKISLWFLWYHIIQQLCSIFCSVSEVYFGINIFRLKKTILDFSLEFHPKINGFLGNQWIFQRKNELFILFVIPN